MKHYKTAAFAFAALTLLATAACGKDGTPSSGKDTAAASGDSTAPKPPTYQVKTGVDLKGSPVFDKIKGKKITIGVKSDQPFLGFEDVSTKERSGFDIEIAKMVAADLGFGPDQITYKTVQSANRETALSGGQVDMYVGTYTINDERKKQVSFAGPYLVAHQDLLVRKDDTSIKGPDDLKGKTVCSATGSTPIQRIKDQYKQTKTVEYDAYSLCVDNLMSGQVDAVTTDDAILKGYAAKDPDNLKVVGVSFSDEPYGIGLNKDDGVLRNAVSDALENHEKNGDWKKAYDATLGLSGSPVGAPPALDRY